jgi:hypothetical protein
MLLYIEKKRPNSELYAKSYTANTENTVSIFIITATISMLLSFISLSDNFCQKCQYSSLLTLM